MQPSLHSGRLVSADPKSNNVDSRLASLAGRPVELQNGSSAGKLERTIWRGRPVPDGLLVGCWRTMGRQPSLTRPQSGALLPIAPASPSTRHDHSAFQPTLSLRQQLSPSVRASFSTTMPVTAGRHRKGAEPWRKIKSQSATREVASLPLPCEPSALSKLVSRKGFFKTVSGRTAVNCIRRSSRSQAVARIVVVDGEIG